MLSFGDVTTRVFKSPSPTAIPGIGDSPIPGDGDGESPPIKQILEKNFQNCLVVNTFKVFWK